MPTCLPQLSLKDGRGDSIAVLLGLCHMGKVEHETGVDVEVDIFSVPADECKCQIVNWIYLYSATNSSSGLIFVKIRAESGRIFSENPGKNPGET